MNSAEKEFLKLISNMEVNGKRLTGNPIRILTVIIAEYKGDPNNPKDVSGCHTQSELCDKYKLTPSALSRAVKTLSDASLIKQIKVHDSTLLVPNFEILDKNK